jgi:hypothetical protein
MESGDLAWMAGFLEGEGFFVRQTSTRGYIRVGIAATSTDRDVLERLRVIVPTSRVQGPYLPSSSIGKKPSWRWVLNARPLVVQLATDLRPLMGARRQRQIDALLAHHAAHPARKRVYQPAPHGTRTRYGYGCRCEECRSTENAYQRARTAARKAASGES